MRSGAFLYNTEVKCSFPTGNIFEITVSPLAHLIIFILDES